MKTKYTSELECMQNLYGRGADLAKSDPIIIVCSFCEGTNVKRDAFVEWDYSRQHWVLNSIFDYGICDDCGEETSLKEIHIK